MPFAVSSAFGSDFPNHRTPVRAADDDSFEAVIADVTYNGDGSALCTMTGTPGTFFPRYLIVVNPPRCPHLTAAQGIALTGDNAGRITINAKLFAQVVSKLGGRWRVRLTKE